MTTIYQYVQINEVLSNENTVSIPKYTTGPGKRSSRIIYNTLVNFSPQNLLQISDRKPLIRNEQRPTLA
jgi:hypothetical protein